MLRIDQKRKEEVYRLTGEDIIDVLEARNILDKLPPEEIYEIIRFVKKRLNFPWKEEIDECIDDYFYFKSQKCS